MKSLPAALLLLTFCTTVMQKTPPPAASPAPASLDWRTRVTAARATEDPAQKNEAMLTLMCEALKNRDVQFSGVKTADQVDPADNMPAPIVNFDPRLNKKTSAQARSGAPSRSLENNFGYYFSIRGVPYVVLGPAALDPRSPVFTQLAAEHELYHAANHVGDGRPLDDRELETWTQMFVTYFQDVSQFKQAWRPMLRYYDDASMSEREKAIDRLAVYYRMADATVRGAFEDWLARRKADTPSSVMLIALEKAINS